MAHVIGCWRDRAAYDAFMANGHDRIAAGQAGSYRAIEVRLFGQVHGFGRPLPETFASAGVVRLAHRPAPADPVREQTPAAGLLGGALASSESAGFLMLSAWKASAAPGLPATDEFIPIPGWIVVPWRA